jgi:predicted LPLAT superfamily acyltransferase
VLKGALAEGKGVILLGAHVGNWEVGGHSLGKTDLVVNLVLVDKEARRIKKMLDSAMEDRRFKILTASSDLLSSIPILAALRRGEIVAFNGDRSVEGLPSVEASFLGGKADFPIGPYLLSALSGAPIIQSYAMRDAVEKYRFFCFRHPGVKGKVRGPDDPAIKEATTAFATRLESLLEQYPFQWYNFYSFWKE